VFAISGYWLGHGVRAGGNLDERGHWAGSHGVARRDIALDTPVAIGANLPGDRVALAKVQRQREGNERAMAVRSGTQAQTNGVVGAELTRPMIPDNSRGLVDRFTELTRSRFAPRAARFDAEAAFPIENYRDLHAAGLLGLTVPKLFGGVGADPFTYALCMVELAKGCSATALTFNMHATVMTIIDTIASEEQKRRVFREVIEGGKLVASLGSEPGSSFRDLYVVQTRFQPVDGGYRVKGVKHFCSIGEAADIYAVIGLIEGTTSARDGLLCALIHRTNGGITVEPTWDAVGMRGTRSDTIHFDTLVTQADVLGGVGAYLKADLAGFGLGYAAVYLGIAEAAFEYILEYARTKVLTPATHPIGHHPLVQRTIAEMATRVRAGRLLLSEAAQVKMSGDSAAATVAINQAKYFCAEVGVSVTEQAMRLAGGRSILKALPLERWHRDALAGPVMPPANDRCLETVGKILCGLEASTIELE
jgi:alkylation response protein AidB-like acyl-CoA dehydrogenase